MEWLYVIIGGFVGAISRFFVGTWAKKAIKREYPFGTFVVNLFGSFLLGYLYATASDSHYALFGIGFMGAFTTFSTMNIEAIQLLQQKKLTVSMLYLLFSYVGGILLAFLGVYLGQ